ncbi:hypothetical protein FRC0505_01987 [Corynebacterium diphtheriae]|uniref:hypothetical protein n=1 Tax=Corynebacterium diphtheriae TaxID=1717 RepID=UPI0013CD849B|nr:hypothetical protein [Corynebacterium diphtheriae]MBG9303311.1 hypothetical protein [Corynebacterium diphtheriae bv. mitis]MBG9305764.1 hypothetical protein [Corynebacterium diphtheriae bv. mitis]CAB0521211.1 hypothetical protein CIP107505_01858 [Corynebacterium diphtheriae]CAB0521863.1 hypothetical protein CIP107502_01905 [Corynebacterium diphtheriae]CAB0567876.1 hypothetical protein CIP107510_01981 [Corynebacterium diphtheriae]
MRDNTHSFEGVARLLLRSEAVARNVAILDTINADSARSCAVRDHPALRDK